MRVIINYDDGNKYKVLMIINETSIQTEEKQ